MRCRGCGGGHFEEVIDLGMMPLVNNLLRTAEEACVKWPLKVMRCEGCTLVQLTETPPPPAMFDEYVYYSSQSQTMVRHAEKLVERHVRAGQRVVEVASNDGYLLKPAKARGAKVLGVDPAKNIAESANAAGIETRCEYFGEESAKRIREEWGEADVMFANNVLAHVPDPGEIARGIRLLLARGGRAHIECPWLMDMIASTAFDTIYHEHQCYFSVTAVKRIFNDAGLRVVDVMKADIHGGSIHVVVSHEGDEDEAMRLMDIEELEGIRTADYYKKFRQRVRDTATELFEVMDHATTIGAFGAAAKGVVMLNHFGITRERVEWVADVSPHKQGRYIPGTRQRIVAPEYLLEEQPDLCLLLPWNLRNEIVARNGEYLKRGGRFVVPLPEVTEVGYQRR